MSQIQPLRGIRYNENQADVSSRLAPPYDVLDAADKQRLLAGHPANFVKIDLPHVPAKQAGPPAVYEQAAEQLKAWLADGTMVREEKPALYVYHQAYRHAGRDYLRRMFFARLRLEPFGKGSVFPHEQTFGGPKEDRLALTRATGCNLSPIFGLFPDPSGAVADLLAAALPRQPLLYGMLDHVENRVWSVTDPALISKVQGLMERQPTFIADGHHRYGTGLLYRDELTKRGSLSTDHPANFVLCVFCAMEDAGLLILPTHRVLPGKKVSLDWLRGDSRLEITELSAESPDAAVTALARFGPQAVALFVAGQTGYQVVRPREATLLDAIEPSHSEAWRRLGLAVLHAYLLDRVIAPKLGGAPEIHYVKSASDAVAEATQTGGSVFLMQPTTMAEMSAVCQAGDLMPQKSTFFYPKLASGLVVNPLYE